MRDDKRGVINNTLPSILERLEMGLPIWETLTHQFESQFSYWVGNEHIVRKAYQDRHYQRIPKLKQCANFFG